jgi:hypothetical protein
MSSRSVKGLLRLEAGRSLCFLVEAASHCSGLTMLFYTGALCFPLGRQATFAARKI